MSVTPDDVRHIAALARLGVADARVPSLVSELNGILQHMQILQSVELAPGNDSEMESGPAMPLRDDIADPVPLQHPRESFAPAMREGFFLVPRLATHGTPSDIDQVAATGEDDE